MPCLFIVIATFIPFCLYQWYAFTHFCGLTKPLMNYAEAVIAYADANDLKLPSTIPKSPWCIDEESESIIQSLLRRVSYRYVQSHYWDQGFLRYFQFKQIPQVRVAIVNSTNKNCRYSRIVNKSDTKYLTFFSLYFSLSQLVLYYHSYSIKVGVSCSKMITIGIMQ